MISVLEKTTVPCGFRGIVHTLDLVCFYDCIEPYDVSVLFHLCISVFTQKKITVPYWQGWARDFKHVAPQNQNTI
jgi:hypothetical protein